MRWRPIDGHDRMMIVGHESHGDREPRSHDQWVSAFWLPSIVEVSPMRPRVTPRRATTVL